MATAKVTNTVTQTLDGAIANEISSVGITYGDLISMEKDSTGRVTALTSNMAELNRLRTSILSAVVTAVDTLDQEQLAIPVGNLTGINFLSGRGISLPVEVVAVGSAVRLCRDQPDPASDPAECVRRCGHPAARGYPTDRGHRTGPRGGNCYRGCSTGHLLAAWNIREAVLCARLQ